MSSDRLTGYDNCINYLCAGVSSNYIDGLNMPPIQTEENLIIIVYPDINTLEIEMMGEKHLLEYEEDDRMIAATFEVNPVEDANEIFGEVVNIDKIDGTIRKFIVGNGGVHYTFEGTYDRA